MKKFDVLHIALDTGGEIVVMATHKEALDNFCETIELDQIADTYALGTIEAKKDDAVFRVLNGKWDFTQKV